MKSSLVTFGDIEIRSEPVYTQDLRMITRTLTIGPVEVRVYLHTVNDVALMANGITMMHYLDPRDIFPYALEAQENLTEEEALKIVDILDGIEKRVRERLGVLE